jgi:hypothetical protein
MIKSWAITSILRGLKFNPNMPNPLPGTLRQSLPGFRPARHPEWIAQRRQDQAARLTVSA